MIALSSVLIGFGALLFGQTEGVSPLIKLEQARLEALDADAGDEFGHNVQISGDTAVVGAPLDEESAAFAGSAYVFVRTGATWTQQAKLLPDDATSSDRFGWSVAIDGDTIVVGTIFGDGAAGVSGTAYVFVRSGTTWSQQAKLAPLDGAAADWFARSVAVSGDTIAVGAPQDDDNGTDSGSVYVFTRSGTTWSQQDKLLASDGGTLDWLGQSVALDGDTVVAGAPQDDDGGVNAGAAYVFTRSGTSWSEQDKLIASDSSSQAWFGYSADLSGESALLGAYRDDATGGDSGSAYVFLRTGTTWSEQQKLVPGDAAAGDECGFTCALDGDLAVVGGHNHNAGGAASGAAWLFARDGSSWSERGKLVVSDSTAADQMAYSVGMSGPWIISGAIGDAPGGSAYVFDAFTLRISPDPLVAGQSGSFLYTDGVPLTSTFLGYSLVGPGSKYVPQLDIRIDLANPQQAGGAVQTNIQGAATANLHIPAAAAGRMVWLQAVQFQRKTNRIATVIQ